MTLVSKFVLALALTTTIALGTEGCAVPGTVTSACVQTPFISPTAITLDHTVANNSQQFTTGINYSSSCAIPAVIPQYTWTLSDTVDASLLPSGNLAAANSGLVTCNSAALNPITVGTTIASSSNPPTYNPSGLPSATLTCK
jgi:hypothetical protein